LTRVYGHDRFRLHSQHVHPKHPPDQKYRDDTPDDVNDPVASCLRLSKIEHAPMVAGPAYVRDACFHEVAPTLGSPLYLNALSHLAPAAYPPTKEYKRAFLGMARGWPQSSSKMGPSELALATAAAAQQNNWESGQKFPTKNGRANRKALNSETWKFPYRLG